MEKNVDRLNSKAGIAGNGKFNNLNFNLKQMIIEYLENREQFVLLTLKEMYPTCKKLKLFELFKEMSTDFAEEIKSNKTPINEVLNKKYIFERIKKFRKVYNKTTLKFCLGLVLSKVLKDQGIVDVYLKANINTKMLFYLSLIVSCTSRFKELFIEINNKPPLTDSLQEALRQLFYNLKKNPNFVKIRFTYSQSMLTYTRHDNSLMLRNISNSFILLLYDSMCNTLGDLIERLHINFDTTNIVESDNNLFKSILKTGKLKYLSLNFNGVHASVFRSYIVKNWFTELIKNNYILDHFYILFAKYYVEENIAYLLEKIKTRKLHLEAFPSFECNTAAFEIFGKPLCKNQFECLVLDFKFFNIYLCEVIKSQTQLRELEILMNLKSSQYVELLEFLLDDLKLKSTLKFLKIYQMMDYSPKLEVLGALVNFITHQGCLEVLDLEGNKFKQQEKDKITQAAGDKLKIKNL